MKRLLSVPLLVVLFVGLLATPAFAHSSLQSTDPAASATVVTAPKAVTLTFNEGVEASLGAIRVFDSRGQRLEVGSPIHPGGNSKEVRSSLPSLRDGTYVVTWRVLSADSHPVRGAFTFAVGAASASEKATASLTSRLLTDQGGSALVGTVYAAARFAVFLGLAVLIGASAFLAFVWPSGRTTARARRVVWIAWLVAFVATVIGFMLQGPYAAGLSIPDAFKPSIWSDVWSTRFGHIWIGRAVLLLLALPLLGRLLPGRGPEVEHPLPKWWPWAGVVLGLALSATPGLAAHAASGPLIGLAIPADTIHVFGVGLWLGGVVMLALVLLPRSDEGALRRAVPRYSMLALTAMIAIVISGTFQAFRQVGRIGALVDTDYGRLLLAKILLFLGLIVVATLSRDIVNRRWKLPPEVLGEADAGGIGGGGADVGRAGGPTPNGGKAAKQASGVAVLDDDLDEEYPEGYILDERTAERRLKRALVVELVIAGVILALTALLVNAPPPREIEGGPFAATLKSDKLQFDTVLTPARRGTNELHLTALTNTGGNTDVVDMSAELSQPANDIAPIKIKLIRAGPGHYISNGFAVPFAGDWRLTLKALVSDVDESTVTATVPIR